MMYKNRSQWAKLSCIDNHHLLRRELIQCEMKTFYPLPRHGPLPPRSQDHPFPTELFNCYYPRNSKGCSRAQWGWVQEVDAYSGYKQSIFSISRIRNLWDLQSRFAIKCITNRQTMYSTLEVTVLEAIAQQMGQENTGLQSMRQNRKTVKKTSDYISKVKSFKMNSTPGYFINKSMCLFFWLKYQSRQKGSHQSPSQTGTYIASNHKHSQTLPLAKVL